MEEELKKFIGNARKIKMTGRERLSLRSRIASLAALAEPSPYFSFFSLIHLKKALVLAAIVLLLAGGGGVAFAAKNTLPGDFLYPIKTRINEPVQGMFARSREAKLAWVEDMVKTRLEETDALVSKDKLTEKTKKIIEKELTAYEEKINKISKDKDSIEAKSIIEKVSKNRQIIRKAEIKEGAEKPKPNKERQKPEIKTRPKF